METRIKAAKFVFSRLNAPPSPSGGYSNADIVKRDAYRTLTCAKLSMRLS